MLSIDALIGGFDRALRTVAGVTSGKRERPDIGLSEADMSPTDRAHAAALMRVNHVGEVCAQALYQGQSLTARGAGISASLRAAADEEADHLAWCAGRIRELGGSPSLLNPAWYAGALALGAIAGAAGDRWNLAFLAETEQQVERHLESHLARLPEGDAKSRAIVSQMRDDEARHRRTALDLGAAELPAALKTAMQVAARAMTTLSYRV